MARLKAPDGTGIKGGKVEYHTKRMLTALSFIGLGMAEDFAASLAAYHARLAARAALNGMGRKA